MHSPDHDRNILRHERTSRKTGDTLRSPGEGPLTPRSTRCTGCGGPLEPAARFCGECGAPVASADTAAVSGSTPMSGSTGSADAASGAPGATRRLPAAPEGTFDEEDDIERMAAYRNGLIGELHDRLEERLGAMGRLLFRDPAEARTYHEAHRPREAVGWVCNANGYLHPSPAQCRNAHRGGRWVTEWEGITRPEEIPWDTIEE